MSQQILELLLQLNRDLNVTLLMVTHDPEAASIAHRHWHLDHGRLVEIEKAPAKEATR